MPNALINNETDSIGVAESLVQRTVRLTATHLQLPISLIFVFPCLPFRAPVSGNVLFNWLMSLRPQSLRYWGSEVCAAAGGCEEVLFRLSSLSVLFLIDIGPPHPPSAQHDVSAHVEGVLCAGLTQKGYFCFP